MVQMLRPWPLHIPLDRQGPAALHSQISQAVAAGVRSGRLPPGSPLPGTRELAAQLGVNRKTVQLAYDDLVAGGWATAQGRRGTFIAPEQPAALCPAADAGPPPVTARHRRVVPSPPAPEMIVFDDGAPDTRLVPVTALAQAYRNALLRLSSGNRLADEHPLGNTALRRSISTMLNFNRGMATVPERICLTRGSQMAIFLAARLLTGPGTVAAMEEPGYSEARAAFRAAGADLAPIPVDRAGLRVDALEELCRHRPPACVYVTPHHQFPTTVSLTPERRRHLLDLSGRYGFTILEDDYDHEFHFVRAPILPVASLDGAENIVYIGTFSKLLSPHLRSGYLTGPAWFIRRAAAAVRQIDRLGDPVTELAVADLIDSGVIQRHHEKARHLYDQRRQAFGTMLHQTFGPLARCTLPDGGLACWVEFDAPFGAAGCAARMRAAGIRPLPGRIFWAGKPNPQTTRIGYAHMAPAQMAKALRRLKQALWPQ
ncbi:GntR family transcriptional regulator/MocR family aminotransferase [Azospirillum fermentarium]|uniref:MocR-like pyridoxine biosynthesis transcription factor PdxR n=1 Tax=Azospirillum fermentarium TaxID=1233114 RepID=UPI002225DA55|nr:PLP-dependent aminotransferase family protein [Azospirillum fermentarium]MCW2248401.1 GntR family transcriptional regulator/MocR family aminotransferase [Azospirillum fermentarium]